MYERINAKDIIENEANKIDIKRVFFLPNLLAIDGKIKPPINPPRKKNPCVEEI